jgi:hypothetical protein
LVSIVSLLSSKTKPKISNKNLIVDFILVI